MTNLPVNLPPIKAFEGASKTIRLDMYEGFDVPGQMVFEVYYNRVKQYDLTPSYNTSSRQLTATFTAEQVKAFPLIADVRVRFDSSYPFRLQIKPTTEGTDDGVVGYTIQQTGDSYTVIEIYAKDEIDAQVEVATQKAEEAAANAIQTSEDRIQTGQDRIATENASLNAQTVALPTDSPASNIKIVNVSTAGTYTNFSGIVVTSGDLSSGLVQLRFEAGVWKKVITPINLAQYTPKPDFQQVTSTISEVVADVTLPTTNGFITTTNSFVGSANWRSSIERPVSEGDIVFYNGVRPTGSGAALIGLDSNKANPVVLIAGTTSVGGQYSESITINSTIKYVSASSRFIAGDVFTLTRTTPQQILLKKNKVDGLVSDLNQIAVGIADASAKGTNAQTNLDKISSDNVVNYAATLALQNGYLNSSGAFVSSANFRTVSGVPATPGQVFTYKGVRPDSTGSAAACVGFDANGLNPVIIIAKTTTGFVAHEQQFTVPSGVFLLSACSRMLGGDVFSLETALRLVTTKAIPNGDLLGSLSTPRAYFMPPISYGKQGDEFRMYPPGIVSMRPKDRGLDLVWNTNQSNEDFASFTPISSDNNVLINLKTRKVDGSFFLIGQTTLRVTHVAQSPASAVNVLVLGDSLIFGVNAQLSNGSAFQGAISNEFSRRLTGVGTPLITDGPASLNLTNIYFRGTQGTQAIKHEGNSGWAIDTYLYSASKDSVVNKFYNAAASGSVKFDLNYYLANNNFQAAQTTGGVDATGNNLVIYIMLGWNHVYNNTVAEAANWLGILMDTIHTSHPNAKVKLFGLNPPPEKIYKNNYTINARNVSPESILRDIFAYSQAWQTVADSRNAWVEFLPVAPYFQSDGAYPSVSKQNGTRGGLTLTYATDYVHPNNVGYAYIADVAYYNFLYHYCRAS